MEQKGREERQREAHRRLMQRGVQGQPIDVLIAEKAHTAFGGSCGGCKAIDPPAAIASLTLILFRDPCAIDDRITGPWWTIVYPRSMQVYRVRLTSSTHRSS